MTSYGLETPDDVTKPRLRSDKENKKENLVLPVLNYDSEIEF